MATERSRPRLYIFVGVTLLAVIVITFEVFMRYVFGLPTNWGHETMTLLFGIQYMMAAGYAHYHRAHVRVDVFYSTRKLRTKAYLDLFTSVFYFIFNYLVHIRKLPSFTISD